MGEHRTRIVRVGKFGAAGILNTVIDFVLYNLLSDHLGMSLVEANIISTTVAMLCSFLINRHIVFKRPDGHVGKQAAMFFLTTAFGLYVLQSGTIHLLTEVWFWPMHTLVSLVHSAGVISHDEFIVKNGAKAIATVISLTWNYIMYRRVVFK